MGTTARLGDDRAERLARLRDLAGELSPLTLARDRRLPVLPALEALLPGGGLQRGSTVAVSGAGATTLVQAVLAGPTRAGSWVAWVGSDSTGWGAAAELGVAMERVVVVETEEERRPTVLAALVDAFDLVVVGPGHRLGPAEARRLEARARERGTVILTLQGPVHEGVDQNGPARRSGAPSGADVHLVCGPGRWSGPGSGWGHLTARRSTVSVEGRRASGRARRWDLLLPGPDGIALVEPAERRGAGSGREVGGRGAGSGRGTWSEGVVAVDEDDESAEVIPFDRRRSG